MSTNGSDGDARERSREVGRSDGLGAGPSRAAAAIRRDLAAEERDSEANQRDGLATAAASGGRSSSRRSTSAQRDERSASDRGAAASDRIEAGLDRAQAAADRELATDGIVNEVRDRLTGAMGPRFGIAAMRREILRTERIEEPLLLAFVEAVAPEANGNESSQVTRDLVLQDVAECVTDDLRDYDLIARTDGGFVCAQSGQSLSRATVRYRGIAERLALRPNGAQMKVGLIAREAGDTYEDLLERSDPS